MNATDFGIKLLSVSLIVGMWAVVIAAIVSASLWFLLAVPAAVGLTLIYWGDIWSRD